MSRALDALLLIRLGKRSDAYVSVDTLAAFTAVQPSLIRASLERLAAQQLVMGVYIDDVLTDAKIFSAPKGSLCA